MIIWGAAAQGSGDQPSVEPTQIRLLSARARTAPLFGSRPYL
jgi:hypothetical protein